MMKPTPTLNWKPRVFGCALLAALAWAAPAPAEDLVDLLPSLYGGDGITLDTTSAHNAHFNGASLTQLAQLNNEITANLGLLALNSTVGGYTFDMELGVPVRSSNSFGPILSERAETMGQWKLNFGCQANQVKFKKFEGDDLDDLTLTFPHVIGDDGVLGPPGSARDFELDEVQVKIDLELKQEVYACYATVGVLDRVDFGISVPFVRIHLKTDAVATVIDNHVVAPPGIHFFDVDPSDGITGDVAIDSVRGHSNGLGDIVVRAKYNFLRGHEYIPDLAMLGQVKLATGDEDDFLGTGDTRSRIMLIASRPYGFIAPHLNVGWEHVGSASNLNNFRYVGGFDVRAHERLTFVVDVMGAYAYNTDLPGDHIIDLGLGLKVNPWRSLILVMNFVIPLNKDHGLRPDWIPMAGLEYTFGGPE